MVLQCSIPGCHNSSDSPGISMLPFPNDKKLRATWCAIIFHGLKRSMRSKQVCSVHFKLNDFVYEDGEKVLKNDAEPSLFLPGSSTTEVPEMFSNFDKLPDLVLLKIFGFLSFIDVHYAGLLRIE